jgi:hypothetical protein
MVGKEESGRMTLTFLLTMATVTLNEIENTFDILEARTAITLNTVLDVRDTEHYTRMCVRVRLIILKVSHVNIETMKNK